MVQIPTTVDPAVVAKRKEGLVNAAAIIGLIRDNYEQLGPAGQEAFWEAVKAEFPKEFAAIAAAASSASPPAGR